MATVDDVIPEGESPDSVSDPRRRDFLNIAAVAFPATAGAVAVLIPLVNQMSPSADVLAESTTTVDLSKIQPGQGVITTFRKQPLFVRNLTPKEVAEANAVPLSELRDPETLEKRTQPGHENWLITLGVCTHLGCIPLGINEGDNRGNANSTSEFFNPWSQFHFPSPGTARLTQNMQVVGGNRVGIEH